MKNGFQDDNKDFTYPAVSGKCSLYMHHVLVQVKNNINHLSDNKTRKAILDQITHAINQYCEERNKK